MIRSIKIDDFANFQDFKIELQNHFEDKLSLSLLVGRNGSGKSCFLDALLQIATHNLKPKVEKEDRKTALNYSIKDDNQIIYTNILAEIPKMVELDQQNIKAWDRIVRFYTGETDRNSHLLTDKILDIDINKSNWLFPTLILSGGLSQHDNEWDLVLTLISNKTERKRIKPEIIWIDSNQPYNNNEESKNAFTEFIDKSGLNEPDFSYRSPLDYSDDSQKFIRNFWKVENIKKKTFKAEKLFELMVDILKFSEESDSEKLIFKDCGFIYSYDNERNSDKFPDQFLSDGEHALLNRYALISMLKNTDERYLVLLDEPETHFNEFWKTEFLYLITETLGKCYNNKCQLKNCIHRGTRHDVFIATHSAMLVTDAKRDEIHRFENRESGTTVYPTPINTYGVNVVDIGKALFQMEADIGRRSQNEIENAIESEDKDKLENLLKEVGPGEWRWKIRTALKEIEHGNRCKNFAKK